MGVLGIEPSHTGESCRWLPICLDTQVMRRMASHCRFKADDGAHLSFAAGWSTRESNPAHSAYQTPWINQTRRAPKSSAVSRYKNTGYGDVGWFLVKRTRRFNYVGSTPAISTGGGSFKKRAPGSGHMSSRPVFSFPGLSNSSVVPLPLPTSRKPRRAQRQLAASWLSFSHSVGRLRFELRMSRL